MSDIAITVFVVTYALIAGDLTAIWSRTAAHSERESMVLTNRTGVSAASRARSARRPATC